MGLKGKRVVVIGGSSGIGLAVARAAAREGALVLVASRSEEKLHQVREELGGRVGIHPLDVRREEEIRALFERVGSLDHLVVTAATGPTGRFLEVEPQAVQELFASKFWGQYLAARHAAPRLREGGSITFFSGVSAKKPIPGFSGYAAVNGAVNALCRALALELAPIRVNVVSPGIVDTPAYQGMAEEKRRDFFAAVAERLPVRRIGRAEDLAEAVLFLMENGFVTGAVFDVDGGGRLV